MMQDRISRLSWRALLCSSFRSSAARSGLIAAVMAWTSASALAGQPLVLDSQRGISDGQPGVVLQNAPLSREPMVEAAHPPGMGSDSSQPFIVAPYVEVPGGGGRPNPQPRPPRPPHRPSQPRPQPLPTPLPAQ
jgi:hypothetical protein